MRIVLPSNITTPHTPDARPHRGNITTVPHTGRLLASFLPGALSVKLEQARNIEDLGVPTFSMEAWTRLVCSVPTILRWRDTYE